MISLTNHQSQKQNLLEPLCHKTLWFHLIFCMCQRVFLPVLLQVSLTMVAWLGQVYNLSTDFRKEHRPIAKPAIYFRFPPLLEVFSKVKVLFVNRWILRSKHRCVAKVIQVGFEHNCYFFYLSNQNVDVQLHVKHLRPLIL